MIVKTEKANSTEGIALMKELSSTLAEITGSTGELSFDLKDMEEERAVFAIAYERDEPVGCGAIRELSAEVAELKRLYAKKKGAGVGSEILAYLEQKAVTLGYKRLILETRKCNEGAVQFYLHNQYKVIKNYGKYLNRDEAICFEKVLG